MKKKILIVILFIFIIFLVADITKNIMYAKNIILDGTTKVASDHTWLCDCYDVDDVDCKCVINL